MKRFAVFAAFTAACMLITGCGYNEQNAVSEQTSQVSQTEVSITTKQNTAVQTMITTAVTTSTTREEPVIEPIENTEQTRLKRLILDSITDEDKRDGFEIIKPIFGDLDGDGTEELIAVYGDPDDSEKELGFGAVWFASENEAEKLSGTWYSDDPIYDIGGNVFLNVMTPGLWGQSYSLIRIAYGNAINAMPVDYSFCESWDYDEETQLFTLVFATADPEVSETRMFMFSDYTKRLEVFEELSDSTEYYACRYEQTADYVTGEEFPDKVLINSAREQLLLSYTYKEVYDRAKQELSDSEPLIAVNCDFVYTCDLDSDGSNEYAFLFNLSPDYNGDNDMATAVWGAIDPNSPYIGVICDSKGNYHVCDQRFAMNARIAVLRYNGFAQFVFFGGVSNNSSLADFYSYYDGEFELELREFNVYGIRDDVFLVQTMAQSPNAWLILWNDDIKGYVTPAAYTLTDSDEIYEQLPLSTEERENCKGAPVRLIAGKYYCMAGYCFEKTDSEFVRVACEEAWNYGLDERHMRYSDPFRIPFADIDYDTVVANVIPVESEQERLERLVVKNGTFHNMKINEAPDVIPLFYGDFDGDRTEELIAVYGGTEVLADGTINYWGELWFASGETVMRLDQNRIGSYFSVDLVSNKDGTFIKFEDMLATYWLTNWWRIDGSSAEPVRIDGVAQMDLRYTDEGEIVAIQSAYDAAPGNTGHTWKTYWYYYDSEANSFVQYNAQIISEEQFRGYEGGETFYQSIVDSEESYTPVEYLLYDNGILAVNCIVYIESEDGTLPFGYNYYFLYDTKDGVLSDITYKYTVQNNGHYIIYGGT